MRAGYPDESGVPEVQITNPAGGILGGDRLEIEAALGRGCSATVLTQGAGKIYRGMKSEQSASFEVADGAFLEYLPHHAIPFAASDHRQTSEFALSGDAALLCWEAFSAGRVARGERFAFERLSGRTRVSRDGRPEVVDGLELRGGEQAEPFGGFSYLGTLTFAAAGEMAELADKIHHAMPPEPRALASASSPRSGLCVARVLAADAETLYSALRAGRRLAREFLRLPPPAREVR